VSSTVSATDQRTDDEVIEVAWPARAGAWAGMAARSRWTYLLVVSWAAGWRILYSAIDHVPAYYFPDSWNYVVKSRKLATIMPLHSPQVWRVWDYLLPGVPTERSVMALQFAFGVAGVAILYHLLRRWGSSVWMLLLAMLYGCIPLLAFADRTLLAESATIFFWLVAALALCNVIATELPTVRAINAAVGGLAAGVAIALRPATRYMVAAMVVLAMVAAFVILWRRRGEWWVVAIDAVATVTVFTAFALPVPMRLMADNEATWGISSLTPATGSVLAARWSALIDCGPFDGVLPATRAALEQVCQTPGTHTDQFWLLWQRGPLHSTMRNGPDFPRIQSELSAATSEAVRRHPGLAVGSLVDRTRRFYFHQANDLGQFHNGSKWLESGSLRATFGDWERWFGGDRTRSPLVGRTPLERAIVRTMRIPFVLTVALVGFLGLLLARILWGTGRRRRLRAALTDAGVLIMLVMVGTLVVGVASVAAGGLAVFRYWAPLLPPLVLALGGAIGVQGTVLDPVEAADEVPADALTTDALTTDAFTTDAFTTDE
jgi:4-amino-4-deoxy-L-arabinose transferase-like glycosyltransferase